MSHIDDLVSNIIDGRAGHGASRVLIGALFDAPKSIVKLRRLLKSDNPEAASLGIFVASELGVHAWLLTRDMLPFLSCNDAKQVAGALDVVMVNATESDGDIIGIGIELVANADRDMRYLGMNFVTSLDVSQINWGIPHVNNMCVRYHAQWLVGLMACSAVEQIRDRLDSDDGIARVFGVSAAIRLANCDSSTLRYATQSKDSLIAEYAAHRLAQLV